MKYVVMECHPAYAILLDEQGRFVRAANFRYEVGQVVQQPVLMRDVSEIVGEDIADGFRIETEMEAKTERKKRPVPGWMRSITALAACLLLLFMGYYQNGMAYTSIYLTINPSVEMELNRNGNVVKINGLNQDGRDLLEGYELRSWR